MTKGRLQKGDALANNSKNENIVRSAFWLLASYLLAWGLQMWIKFSTPMGGVPSAAKSFAKGFLFPAFLASPGGQSHVGMLAQHVSTLWCFNPQKLQGGQVVVTFCPKLLIFSSSS